MSAIEDRISTLEQYLESTKSTVGELAEELENVRQTRTERRSELEELRQELRERTDQRVRRAWLEEQGYDHTTLAEEPVALGVKNLPAGKVQVDMVENSEVLGSVTLLPFQSSSLFSAVLGTTDILGELEKQIKFLESGEEDWQKPAGSAWTGRHLFALRAIQHEARSALSDWYAASTAPADSSEGGVDNS